MSAQRRGSGEGAIFQRPDGRWEARLDLGWTPTGRRRKSVYGKTRREVADKLRTVQNLHDHEQVIGDERLTVERWLSHWSANILGNHVANGTITQTTADHYGDVVRLHLVPGLGRIRLTKLTPDHVDAFLMDKAAKGYRPNSRRIFRGTLRKALRDAERAGHVMRNVATLSEPVRLERRAKGWLTLPEARRLLEAARGDHLEAAVVVGLSLGLRRSELLALRWSSFDFDRSTVLITQTLTRVRNAPGRPGYDATLGRTRLELKEPKTTSSTRLQFVPPPAFDALRAHRKRQATDRLAAASWPAVDLVFTTPVGTMVDPANFAKTISRLCIKAGLGHRNPPQLRHSAATIMLAQGVPLHIVSDVLGHSSISVTKDVYGHVEPEQLAQAAEDHRSPVERQLWAPPLHWVEGGLRFPRLRQPPSASQV